MSCKTSEVDTFAEIERSDAFTNDVIMQVRLYILLAEVMYVLQLISMSSYFFYRQSITLQWTQKSFCVDSANLSTTD